MVEFQLMTSIYNHFYHQANTSIKVLCKRDSHPDLLFNNNKLYLLS